MQQFQKAAEDAAAKALPAMTAAMKGMPVEWIPKWTEFRRVFGGTNAAKPLLTAALAQRDQQRANAVLLFTEAQSFFRAEKRDDAFKVLEKLRDEAPQTYQGYFAWKWIAGKK